MSDIRQGLFNLLKGIIDDEWGPYGDDHYWDMVDAELPRLGLVVATQEQLDALPFLAIIREVFKPSPGRGLDYGGVYERRTSGWHAIAGTYKDPADNGAPKLPCRVLYNPTIDQ
jgi:hypothetical protein